jgi:hypothetical protein
MCEQNARRYKPNAVGGLWYHVKTMAADSTVFFLSDDHAMQNYWLFQANPTYRLTIEVPPRLGKSVYWLPKLHLQEMKDGDGVVLWQSGLEAGAYAVGRLVGPPYKKNGEWRVDIQYEKMLKHPHFKSDLLRHPVLRNLKVMTQWWAANPFSLEKKHWQALKKLDEVDALNIFSHYKQEENQFTNGLVSLLSLSRYEGNAFLNGFLHDVVELKKAEATTNFRVLRHIDGTADAELQGPNCCIRLETKIKPNSLEDDQVHRHVERLSDSAKAIKALILLTPDDSDGKFIREFVGSKWLLQQCSKSTGLKVVHLEWKKVYKFLEEWTAQGEATVFSELVSQFRRRIREGVFAHDYVGVIQKISFGDKSGVYHQTTDKHVGYLDEVEDWETWDTPKLYSQLSGEL